MVVTAALIVFPVERIALGSAQVVDDTSLLVLNAASASKGRRVQVHDPLRESNPGRGGIANDGGAIGERLRQSLLVDIHYHRVARCPGAGGAVDCGVEQRVLATIAVKANGRELNDRWRRYRIDIERAPIDGFV